MSSPLSSLNDIVTNVRKQRQQFNSAPKTKLMRNNMLTNKNDETDQTTLRNGMGLTPMERKYLALQLDLRNLRNDVERKILLLKCTREGNDTLRVEITRTKKKRNDAITMAKEVEKESEEIASALNIKVQERTSVKASLEKAKSVLLEKKFDILSHHDSSESSSSTNPLIKKPDQIKENITKSRGNMWHKKRLPKIPTLQSEVISISLDEESYVSDITESTWTEKTTFFRKQQYHEKRTPAHSIDTDISNKTRLNDSQHRREHSISYLRKLNKQKPSPNRLNILKNSRSTRRGRIPMDLMSVTEKESQTLASDTSTKSCTSTLFSSSGPGNQW